MFSIALVIFFFALDLAKKCKPVKYEFKQFGVKFRGWGGKKGCYPTNHAIHESKTADFNVFECSEIKKDANLTDIGGPDLTGYDDERLEYVCNWNADTCVWKKGKCKAASCPNIAERHNCGVRRFKNGKCEILKGDDCTFDDQVYMPTPANANCNNPAEFECPSDWSCNNENNGNNEAIYSCRSRSEVVPCSRLVDYFKDGRLNDQYTSDDKKVCEYKCEKPQYFTVNTGPYQFTVADRKYCHRQLGCLYRYNTDTADCSSWAIWAYVLFLVPTILLTVFFTFIYLVIKLSKN